MNKHTLADGMLEVDRDMQLLPTEAYEVSISPKLTTPVPLPASGDRNLGLLWWIGGATVLLIIVVAIIAKVSKK